MVTDIRRRRWAVREKLESAPELTPDEKVDQASLESFPASDSPGWMSGGCAPIVEKRKARRTRIQKTMHERAK